MPHSNKPARLGTRFHTCRNYRDPFSCPCTSPHNRSIHPGTTTRTHHSNTLPPLRTHCRKRRNWRSLSSCRCTRRSNSFVQKHNPARTFRSNMPDPHHKHCRMRHNVARPMSCRHRRRNNPFVQMSNSGQCSLVRHCTRVPSGRLRVAAAFVASDYLKIFQFLSRVTSGVMGSNTRFM